MAVEYEKGRPKNIVEFSDDQNLAFKDSGYSINDHREDKSNLWSSAKTMDQMRIMFGVFESKITGELKNIMARTLLLEQSFNEKLNAAQTKINALHLKLQTNINKCCETSGSRENLAIRDESPPPTPKPVRKAPTQKRSVPVKSPRVIRKSPTKDHSILTHLFSPTRRQCVCKHHRRS